MVGPLSNDKVLALAQIESSTYLRNQLLRDSDWASMYHSIELRTPLVDAKLIDRLKHLLPLFKQYKGKVFLANSPNRPLPDEIINRPKTGFSIPVKSWMIEKYGNNLSWQQKVYENWML